MADKPYKVIEGDMLKILPTLAENSFDACVTDPPYELGFMGKKWDSTGVAFKKETWEQVYRVLKNGAYLLAFGGSRCFHRMACAIEDAGFEIRDCIMWLYGSGFPKSMSLGKVIEGKQVLGSANVKDIKKLNGKKEIVGGGWNSNEVEQGKRKKEYEQTKTKVEYTTELGKKWDGWGTCLKPSYEPIIVARKPLEGGVVDNVLKWGVGGINIDECRVGEEGAVKKVDIVPNSASENCGFGCNGKIQQLDMGRFPANTILTYDETDFEEVCGGMPYTKGDSRETKPTYNKSIWGNAQSVESNCLYDDEGSAARYFYCAKASKKDRDEGLELFNIVEKSAAERTNRKEGSAGINAYAGATGNARNFHPTVKPVELMQYLIRLVTPKGGNILEPFAGSGTTGKAAMFENRERNANYTITMCELTHDYIPIIEARCDYALNKYKYEILEVVKEHKENGQMSLFDDLLGGEAND